MKEIAMAVLEQISDDEDIAKDIAKEAAHYGGSAGFPGFTLSSDCREFVQAKFHLFLSDDELCQCISNIIINDIGVDEKLDRIAWAALEYAGHYLNTEKVD